MLHSRWVVLGGFVGIGGFF